MTVRYAHSGNNRIETGRMISGITNYCYLGNSPVSEYLSENKTQKYLLPKIKKSLRVYVEKVYDEKLIFRHQRKNISDYELYCVLRKIIEGCDYDTLKEAQNIFNKVAHDFPNTNLRRGVRFLLDVI